MSTPLTNDQKRIIGRLARAAYQAWPEREAFELINSELSKTACFEAWRHDQQGKACGVQHLRACTQDHYGRLKAHFQALAGDTAGATHTRGRDADNDRRIARFKLAENLRERGLTEAYAAAICRSKYKRSLDEATAAQLWKLVYDVRTRRKALPKAPVEDLDDGNPF